MGRVKARQVMSDKSIISEQKVDAWHAVVTHLDIVALVGVEYPLDHHWISNDDSALRSRGWGGVGRRKKKMRMTGIEIKSSTTSTRRLDCRLIEFVARSTCSSNLAKEIDCDWLIVVGESPLLHLVPWTRLDKLESMAKVG